MKTRKDANQSMNQKPCGCNDFEYCQKHQPPHTPTPTKKQKELICKKCGTDWGEYSPADAPSAMLHTPTPLTMKQRGSVADLYEGERLIAKDVECMRAAFIVLAVNSHEELLEALKVASHMANQDLVPSVQRTDDWEKIISKAEGK